MGTVLYELLTGKPLFKCNSIYELIRKQSEPIDFPSDSKLPQAAKDLILSMLNSDYENRPECQKLLEYEFFEENCEQKYEEMERIQEEYLFISIDDKEENEIYTSKEKEGIDIKNSEYLEDPEENAFEFISVEIDFYVIEELLKMMIEYLLPQNTKICIYNYINYKVPMLISRVENISQEFYKYRAFQKPIELFREKLRELSYDISLLQVPIIQYDQRIDVNELDCVISSVSMHEAYLLSLVKMFVMI